MDSLLPCAQQETGKAKPATWVSPLSRFRDFAPPDMGEPHDIAPRGSGHLSCCAIWVADGAPQDPGESAAIIEGKRNWPAGAGCARDPGPRGPRTNTELLRNPASIAGRPATGRSGSANRGRPQAERWARRKGWSLAKRRPRSLRQLSCDRLNAVTTAPDATRPTSMPWSVCRCGPDSARSALGAAAVSGWCRVWRSPDVRRPARRPSSVPVRRLYP